MEDFASRTQNFQNKQQNTKEGDVIINAAPGSKKQFTQDSGEYVDFEEIKD